MPRAPPPSPRAGQNSTHTPHKPQAHSSQRRKCTVKKPMNSMQSETSTSAGRAVMSVEQALAAMAQAVRAGRIDEVSVVLFFCR